RFEAYGWHVLRVPDVNDLVALDAAIRAAQAETDRPSLIICRTHIGYGSPNKVDSAKAHGEALGAAEIEGARAALGWTAPPFVIPEPILEAWRAAGRRSVAAREAWERRLAASPQREAFKARLSNDLPDEVFERLSAFKTKMSTEAPKLATRKSSEMALGEINAATDKTVGGSADLTHSNFTITPGMGSVGPDDASGRYIHYGVREHAMAAVMNGLALHGGFVPYGGTFLTFADYARGAIRLSALMGLRVVYVMTHDSIGLGEDGPTHQPVEHLWALRAIPGLDVVRPADANEVTVAWRTILDRTDHPAALSLSRQNLPVFDRAVLGSADGTARGGYVLADADGAQPDVILIGTGSEVQLALAASKLLAADGIKARVVSMPCVEWFSEQDASYRDQVLPPHIQARVSVEAGIALGWHQFVGTAGRCVSLEHFGASADYKKLYAEFGITADSVAEAARDCLANVRPGEIHR
ncbi:MAG TPA: transketolase, partial [Streptosporangiaceae bacterium]|nr:transketolase [Streptosporangiaceae bacterium]